MNAADKETVMNLVQNGQTRNAYLTLQAIHRKTGDAEAKAWMDKMESENLKAGKPHPLAGQKRSQDKDPLTLNRAFLLLILFCGLYFFVRDALGTIFYLVLRVFGLAE